MHPAKIRGKTPPEVPSAHTYGFAGGPDAGPPTPDDRNSRRQHLKVRLHEVKTKLLRTTNYQKQHGARETIVHGQSQRETRIDKRN